MRSLVEIFPSLVAELSRQLRAAGQAALADQVDAATIARVSFDGSAGAGYIQVQPSRELNAVEKNIMGVRHGDTLKVDTRYSTSIDTDNFGRLMGIEILAAGDIREGLKKHASC